MTMADDARSNVPMRGRVEVLQLEITYRCQLLCPRCNRHCNLQQLEYLHDADLTMAQLDRCIGQIRSADVHLRQIRVLGGEPLLHPQIDEFLVRLVSSLMIDGFAETIVVVTNGVIPARERLSPALAGPAVRGMIDQGRIQFQIAWPGKQKSFRGVLVSPADMGMPWRECGVPRVCGSCLNAYGYWPNGNCGAVARLFGMGEYARFEFPIVFEDTWPHLEADLCRHCVKGSAVLVHNASDAITRSYRNAIDSWTRGSRPAFRRF